MNAIDLFAGAGGWDLAACELGFEPLGIELDPLACQTRVAAGFRTLQADDGVPQTRERAILMASRVGVVHPPVATHQRYVSGEPARHEITLEGELLPWVSMADALGWGMVERPCVTVAAGSGRQGGPDALDGGSGARATIQRERERESVDITAGGASA